MEWLSQLAQLLRRPAVSWWDVVDIVLVSVLIYELLLLIRGTRAVQMALSAGFLIGLFFVSRWFDLETVNWVIRNLATYVGFAIIVLFQADIRRALAHFGRAPFFKYFERVTSADETIEDLVVAASTLAARRIGAIIVIERQIGLRNYIEGGIPLDATITYDLLATIFQPGSPLHDGAVIVQGDRIAAAACFLPLSINPKVSRELGTRHRAALGITEENDAIAIVVSEETGAISVALAGALERGLTPERLRDRLRALLTGRADRRASGTRLSGLMAILRIRHVGLKVDLGRPRRIAVAAGFRRADSRARAADTARVHQSAASTRTGWFASGSGRRSCARVVRNTEPSCGGRTVRGPRRSDRANRRSAVSSRPLKTCARRSASRSCR